MALRSSDNKAPPGPFSRPFRIEAQKAYPVAVDLSATPEECAAVARALDIPAVENLTARFRVAKAARGRYETTGEVRARLSRECVVSLEPFEIDVREPVEVFFAAPPDERFRAQAGRGPEIVMKADDDDPPEPIVDGRVDLGALAVEFLALGLDPHPRKPGVVFDEAAPARDIEASPFRALGKLKNGGGQ